ncbi:copper chaperone PCu(A)C [Neptunomonas sp.]|uniref:copper chaperone PCu(A)C n=1 Tax=Neptunomonas sp. TaxID=1971898 RepID=UPI0025EFD10C|nr:copper chaperone PCu(A)C [Neptunomonas sp.]
MKKVLLSTILLLSSQLATAEVHIDGAYARAVPPGQMNSATFMQITNDDEKGLSLVSATSDAAKNVELHTHIQDNGVMRMRQINEIKLPSDQKVTLQPGGMHIMMIGLTRNLHAGEHINLSLTFSDGSQKSLQVPVKKIMPMGGKKMMHKHATTAE